MQNQNNADAIDQMPSDGQIANSINPAEESKQPAPLSFQSNPVASTTLVESVAEPTDATQDPAGDFEEKPEPNIDILTGIELTEEQYNARAYDNSSVFAKEQKTLEHKLLKQYTFIDLEDKVLTLQFNHSYDEINV